MASIRAGEDTTLELKEVAFRGHRMQLGSDGARPAVRLAEVFASMANTEGGTVVLGVRDDGVPTSIESDKRELVEQIIINAATEICQPMIVPRSNSRWAGCSMREAVRSRGVLAGYDAGRAWPSHGVVRGVDGGYVVVP